MNKVVLISNIPAPYRENVYKFVSVCSKFDFSVIYCAEIEPNRKWKFSLEQYDKIFLNSRFIDFFNRRLYLGSDIFLQLRTLCPSVVIVCGFSIPMLATYFWAVINGVKIISFTDGTIESESGLSIFHKIIRSIFYKLSSSCLGASKKSIDLLCSYRKFNGVFQSKLSIDLQKFCGNKPLITERAFDVILCGQMIDTKMFGFSLAVISRINSIYRPLRVKILGDGVERDFILDQANSLDIDYSYEGFVQQDYLFDHYSDSKLFLFPSKNEPWGIVANEACASGTPVITTPNTGCSGELIIDGFNGYVLEPDIDLWAKKIIFLLSNDEVLQQYSDNCIIQSDMFTQQQSADGIIKAVEYALMAAK